MPLLRMLQVLGDLCKKLSTSEEEEWVCDTYTLSDQRGVALFPAGRSRTDGFFFVARQHRLIELYRSSIPSVGFTIEEFAALLEYAEGV